MRQPLQLLSRWAQMAVVRGLQAISMLATLPAVLLQTALIRTECFVTMLEIQEREMSMCATSCLESECCGGHGGMVGASVLNFHLSMIV